MVTSSRMLVAATILSVAVTSCHGFQAPLSLKSEIRVTDKRISLLFSSADGQTDDDLSSLLTSRFPTSVEDQVRQASEALRRASRDGIHRHNVRLLLPLIGATELDDWPGGARQMMEAAFPFAQRILTALGAQTINESVIDESDGVRAVLSQAEEPKDDACAVLLPSADTVPSLQSLETQVGPERNLLLINTQWKRRSDFGFFGRGAQVEYVEKFVPTFYCSNLMVEGDQVRVLRSYPGPWRVFLRKETENEVDWDQIGSKDVQESKTKQWKNDPSNQSDGGRLFDYGQPNYREIEQMIVSTDGYVPKSLSERAAAAFTFIKDTL